MANMKEYRERLQFTVNHGMKFYNEKDMRASFHRGAIAGGLVGAIVGIIFTGIGAILAVAL